MDRNGRTHDNGSIHRMAELTPSYNALGPTHLLSGTVLSGLDATSLLVGGNGNTMFKKEMKIDTMINSNCSTRTATSLEQQAATHKR